MARSQSATKYVRCIPFIINMTTHHVTATAKTSKWLPWRYVTQDGAKNTPPPFLSYYDKYCIIQMLTMMVSNAVSQQAPSCERYGYLMARPTVTLNAPFAKGADSPSCDVKVDPSFLWQNVRRQLLIRRGKKVALSFRVNFLSLGGL